MEPKPSGITVSRKDKEMTITWSDSHTSVYPFSLLRAACPCASCRGGHERMSSEPDPAIFERPIEDSPATRLRDVQAVGSYAIAILWEDGHDDGIYTWHYLRALCPCEECRGKSE